MTQEQITVLLNILSNTPTQALMMVALYVAYRDGKEMLKQRLEWLTTQLALYMQRDREIVAEVVKERPLVASKWQSLTTTNGNGVTQTPAPG